MLFKEELPTPRYTLDGDFDDTEINIESVYDIQFHDVPDLSETPLLLIAPRCSSLANDVGGAPNGIISFVVTTKPKRNLNQLISEVQDFYEVDAEEDDFVKSQKYTLALRKGPHGLAVLALPPLSEADSAFLGRSLISKFKPKRVILATPGTSFMDSNVCYMATHDYPVNQDDFPKGLIQAEAPVIVQGVGAAAISMAQQMNIPAIVLVVKSDGPSNYEVISEQGLNELRYYLFQLLHLQIASESQIESKLSILYV